MACDLLILKPAIQKRHADSAELSQSWPAQPRIYPHGARNSYAVGRGTSSMERKRHVCVIDWFGVSYDGTMPSVVFACDENWFGLFPVAPPNPPALESGDG